MKTKLLVMPNFKGFKIGYDEDGSYCLIHPQYLKEKQSTLFGHHCSSLGFAFLDLQYPNRRDFLDEIFGIDNWEFKFYEFTDLDTFKKDMDTYENEKIDVQTIDDLFKKYKEMDKHL